MLPWGKALLEGILGADLIGVHVPRYVRAFENAQNDLLKLTIKGAKPIPITDIVLTSYTEAAQRTHPEYFADLPALPR